MSEKITLQAQSDPEVKITGMVEAEGPWGWDLILAPNTSTNTFLFSEWNLVPPPYELPTGIGAVVEFTRPDDAVRHYVRVHDNAWRCVEENLVCNDTYLTNNAKKLTTLSEGVEL